MSTIVASDTPQDIGPLVFSRNQKYTKRITITDEDDAAVDLSGKVARLEVKASAGTAVLFAFSTTPASGEGLIELDSLGNIDLSVATADATYTWDDGVWDLAFIEGAEYDPLLEGTVSVRDGITVA